MKKVSIGQMIKTSKKDQRILKNLIVQLRSRKHRILLCLIKEEGIKGVKGIKKVKGTKEMINIKETTEINGKNKKITQLQKN